MSDPLADTSSGKLGGWLSIVVVSSLLLFACIGFTVRYFQNREALEGIVAVVSGALAIAGLIAAARMGKRSTTSTSRPGWYRGVMAVGAVLLIGIGIFLGVRGVMGWDKDPHFKTAFFLISAGVAAGFITIKGVAPKESALD